MSKDLILQFVLQALDQVLTDELMLKLKQDLIAKMKELSLSSENKLDDYAVKKLIQFLMV